MTQSGFVLVAKACTQQRVCVSLQTFDSRCWSQVSVTGPGFGPVQPVCAAGERRGVAAEGRRGLHRAESDRRVRQDAGDGYGGAQSCDRAAYDLTHPLSSTVKGLFRTFVDVVSARTAVGHDAEGRLILFHIDGQTKERG